MYGDDPGFFAEQQCHCWSFLLRAPAALLSSTFCDASQGDIHVIGIVQAGGECVRSMNSQPLHVLLS